MGLDKVVAAAGGISAWTAAAKLVVAAGAPAEQPGIGRVAGDLAEAGLGAPLPAAG